MSKRKSKDEKQPSLQQLADAKMAESGLNGVDSIAMKVRPLTREAVGKLDLPAFMALQLPYLDVKGKPTGFYRLRYLEQPTGFAKAKALRYIQPPDTLNEVYLAPLGGIKWGEVIERSDVSLVITEGELKAAAACKAGIPTLGLGGVWCFKSAKRQLPLLPMLSRIQWSGRTVYLCYDSDAVTNSDVVAALSALARELLTLGAVPRVCALPALPKLTKTGLDDYLVAKGPKEFARAVLARAEPFAPAAALYELNAEVAYVKNPGLIVVLAEGRKLSAGGFKEHAYANRHYHEEKITEQGVKLVKKPVAPAWLAWEQRAELERLTYAPGQDSITEDKAYNSWRGWGTVAAKGSVQRWKDLLTFVFKSAQDGGASQRWFEQWCAYPLQHPGVKLFSAAVLWGVHQGTGKSLIGHSLMRIYGANSTEIDDEDLQSTHNEWAESKQFVMGDDVMSSEHKTKMSDRLKAMITQKEIRLNPKYVPSYTVPDCINYLFTSQHPDAFLIEDTDRRYFVHEVLGPPLPRSFYKDYVKWMLYSDEGPGALFHHLLHLSLKDFDAQGPAMQTQAKKLMAEDSLSDLGAWVRRLRNDPDSVLKLGPVPLEGELWSNPELLHLYDPEGKTRVTANGLGRELRRAGFLPACGGMPIRTRSLGQTRLYAIRGDGQKWMQVAARVAVEHYDSTRGEAKDPAAPKRKKFIQGEGVK